MPVTVSDLAAKSAATTMPVFSGVGSSLDVYRNSFAAQRDRAADILKNSGLQVAALNAFAGPSVKAALGLDELFRGPAIEARQAVSRLVGPSVLEFARLAQEVSWHSQFVEQLSALTPANLFAGQDLARLANTSRLVSSQFSALGGSVASVALRNAMLSGVRGWESAATAFVKRPDVKRVVPLEAFGRGTVGVTSAVALLLPERDGITTDAGDDLDLLHPMSLAHALREVLGSLSRRLPQRLDGAWERVSRRGPDAASQAAHSLMETIDLTLRLAAPDLAVLEWHMAEGRPAQELHNGQPTRTLRVEWLLRGRPGEAAAARFHLRALTGLVSVIQSYKHSENEADVEAVARLIPTVEGFLIFVLGVTL